MPELEFKEFRALHADEIDTVQKFIASPLSDDPVVIKKQVANGVAAFGRVNVLLGWSVYYYKLARAAKLRPKDFGTNLDREVALEADTAQERRYREVLEGIVEGLKVFISAGQTLIKAHTQEMMCLSAGRG